LKTYATTTTTDDRRPTTTDDRRPTDRLTD
jgi:hypothetical protein